MPRPHPSDVTQAIRDRAARARAWTPVPRFELAEHPSGYTIHADVPGLREGDVDLAVEGNQLLVAAERRGRMLVRAFALPTDAELAAATADVAQDVLYLMIPKHAPGEHPPPGVLRPSWAGLRR